MPSSAHVNMIVALKAEARPLIAKYRLLPLANQRGLFATSAGDIALVICGVGRANAARAVERMYRFRADIDAAWLNVGIAGHGSEPPGSALLVREILERASGCVTYPAGPLPPAPGTTVLCTVDEPEASYEPGWAYDMEGSGFMKMALRLGGSSPVHSLKIISDGPTQTWSQLSGAVVEELIDSCTGVVDSVLAALTTPDNDGVVA
jgi:adenosylhomocysteine nucleosidase